MSTNPRFVSASELSLDPRAKPIYTPQPEYGAGAKKPKSQMGESELRLWSAGTELQKKDTYPNRLPEKPEESGDESMSGSKSLRKTSKTNSKTGSVAQKDAAGPGRSEIGIAQLLHAG